MYSSLRPQVDGWVNRGAGKWEAVGAELSLDLQTVEVLWRNDDLKPVPDSMTQVLSHSH